MHQFRVVITAAILAHLMFPGGLLAADGTEEPTGVVFSGYGEILYSRFDFGPDQKSGPHGSLPDDRAIVDLQRFVVKMDYDFDESLSFTAEIEYEHGGTGSTLELEYEEFGEYGIGVEKGGEVVLEQLYLSKRLTDLWNLRVGHFIVPVGSINASDLPLSYFGTVLPEAETSIIPVTWHETGIELFGAFSTFNYQAQIVNGLDSTGFGSKYWIRGGHQAKFEQTRATDLALVARLSWTGVRGLKISGSAYHGNTTGNRPKPDMDGITARLTILSSDVRYDRGPWRGRAVVIWGSLDNADEISSKNGRLSTNLGVSRTPVAKEALSWAVELGYDVLPLFGGSSRMALLPFMRYEAVNSMHATDAGVFANPRFDRAIATVGLNWMPTPSVVVKSDYSIRSLGADHFRDEKTFGLALGFVY